MAAIIVGLHLLAPQAIPLAQEGFPKPVWPASGSFATVKGTMDPAPVTAELSPVPTTAQARFNGSNGRALIVDIGGTRRHETYGKGIGADTRLNSYSLVKSLVGVLTLCAVAQGRIATLKDPIATYLGPAAPNVTVAQVLSMTSGLVAGREPAKSLDDGGFSPFSPLGRLHIYGIETELPRMWSDPAAVGDFQYQSANTALLGAILEKVYTAPLPEILSQELWRPAGAGDAYWRLYPKGDGVTAYCCLYARPDDWARVARYLMTNGTQSEPFLPETVWRRWLIPDLGAARASGAYGWHLRHDVLDRDGQIAQGDFAYFFGHNGQLVYLIPQLDAVIVRFGDGLPLLHSTVYDLFP